MTQLHPIPPGVSCGVACVCTLTGAPLAAVVVPALNRAHREASLLEGPVALSRHAIKAALVELGYRVVPAKPPLPHRTVAGWATRSVNYHHPVLLFTRDHALVVAEGKVHDTFAPIGVRAAAHPYGRALVTDAAQILLSTG